MEDKIINIIKTYYSSVKDGGEQAVREATTEFVEAYGGCDKCYGRGFRPVMSNIERDTDDINIGHKNLIINWCNCQRGKNLKELIEGLKKGIK